MHEKWNVKTASLQVFGCFRTEVEIFRHLKIQFRFRVTIWFQNDSRCISIFPAKDFSEILNYNMPALIHKQIKISQYNQNNVININNTINYTMIN